MLIGPQNLTVHVNHVRSRIRHAAIAAGRDPATVTLVAVSKAKTAEQIRLAATAGVTDFGENYLKEASAKMDRLADLPLTWHFIGALQSNKTRAPRPYAAEPLDHTGPVSEPELTKMQLKPMPARGQ